MHELQVPLIEQPNRMGTRARSHCEVCECENEAWKNFNGYDVRLCRSCDHNTVAVEIVRGDTHVDQVYADSYFTGGAAGYLNYVNEARLLRRQGQRYGKLLRRYGVRRVLDIGSAAGYLLNGLADVGVSGVGVEPNASMVDSGRANHLDLRLGTAEEASFDEQFQAVLMVQVISHFFDLHRALARIADATREGGYWLIETWDRSSWTARALGTNWHEYSPPSVLRMFSFNSLIKLAARYRFEMIANGRPRKMIQVAHARSLLEYKAQQSRRMRYFANAISCVPRDASLLYPFDDVRWTLFRKTPLK